MDSERCRLAKRGDLAAVSPCQRLIHSCRSKRSAVSGSRQEDGTDGRDFHHLHHHLQQQQQQQRQTSPLAPLTHSRQESLDVARPGAPRLDVAGLLACAGCSGRVRPPIRQCPRGHLACTPCAVAAAAAGPSPQCPECWEPAAAARNLALERLALMCGVAT